MLIEHRASVQSQVRAQIGRIVTDECTTRAVSSNLYIAEVRNSVLKALGLLEERNYEAHGILLKYTLNPDKLISFPFGPDPIEYVEERLEKLLKASPGVNIGPFADDLSVIILAFERK